MHAAERALEAAQQNIESAKQAAARYLTAKAMGDAGAAPLSVRDARQAAQDAQDELDAATAASESLKKELAAVEHALEVSRRRVEDLTRQVIKGDPLVRTLLSRWEKLQHEQADTAAALSLIERTLWDADGPPLAAWASQRAIPAEALTLTTALKQSLAQLASDPDAPLPVLA